MLNVLFLCTGNSCRSILAEAALNHLGGDKFKAYSAGSFPTGEVHPLSLETLKSYNISTNGYHSKSWDELEGQKIDIVITVCDNAAGETCPVFLGKTIKAHWGVPDPAKFEGTDVEIKAEFERIYTMLERRICALINLPLEQMDTSELQQQLNAIGQAA
jgi:arsenate reductase